MTTALQLMNRAADLIGYKDFDEPLTGADTDNFLSVLNSMIDAWKTDNLLVYANTYEVVTVSTNPVTIGTGAMVDVARPTQILQGGFFRIGNIDYAFDMIEREQYMDFAMKGIPAPWPRYCYYEPALPTGNLYFYPALSGAAELHIPIMQQVQEFVDIATDYDLAPGFRRAIEYSLAQEIAPGFVELSDKFNRMAENARRAIERFEVPMLVTDLSQPRYGNILTGWET